MSRIGRLPITVPAGVQLTMAEGNQITVKGPKGTLEAALPREMNIELNDGVLTVSRPSDSKQHRSLHGLSRALLNNMVIGVTQGFQKTLTMVGVGYRAQLQGKKLILTVGYSHPVEFEQGDGIEFEVPAPTQIIVRGIDKQKVGAIAADIRSVREPEPYLGKGIRYENEVVRRKSGKAGKK